MSPPSPGTVLRSLRHYRPVQLLHQLRHVVAGTVRPAPTPPVPPEWALRDVRTPFLGAPDHARLRDGSLTLLNHSVLFGERIDWDHADAGPLWAFHLHQFDWARDPALAPAVRRAHLLDWIERHRTGIGWRPGPISLRTLAWLKLLLTPGALELSDADDGRVRASLACQLDTLSHHLERRLLANHYLSNLLALTAGGLAFGGAAGDRWLGFAPQLVAELAEQFPGEGAHLERSPMYHALLLEGVLDVLHLAQAALGWAPAELEQALRDTAARGLAALAVYSHPDGEIALFGDSARGIASRPGDLARYAASLGVQPRAPDRPGVLEAAGYVRLARGPWSLLLSVAGPLPAYQPGHAHCDALAFELCLGRDRVVTDTGVFEYVPGPRRTWSRSTRAHATLEVAGREQAEIWSGHRVGGRPRVELAAVEPGIRVEATCAGWATPDTRHRRVLSLGEDGLEVIDCLEGRARRAVLSLPLAPGLDPVLAGSEARLPLAGGGSLRIELPSAARWRTEVLEYYPEFGRSVERAVLIGESDGEGRHVWRFRLSR